MRDLAMYVMRYVRLGDTMSERRRQPSHDRAQISQQVSVVCCQRASWEGELARAVMREKRIGVLKEGDQDDPMVDPVDEKES